MSDDQRVIDYMWLAVNIPVGRENAISREDLARKMGVGDRTMREKISEARRAGLLIMNRQDGRGYYRSNNVSELKDQLTQTHNRALTLLAQEKFLRRRIEEIEEAMAYEPLRKM